MNTTLKIILLCSINLIALISPAQFKTKQYDKEALLIGTLNEYMGYQRTFSSGNTFYFQRIDIISRNELKHALFIDSLFSADYNDITIVNNGAPMGIKMYSPTLSSKIDRYYHYKVMNGHTTRQGDTIYKGDVDIHQLTNAKQKLSYLLGAYLRFGKNEKSTQSIIQHLKENSHWPNVNSNTDIYYAISFPNATSKAKYCEILLKEFNCKNVLYAYRNTIPAGHYVVFTPSPKIKKVIIEAEGLSKLIANITTDHIEFTIDGEKYIWQEPYKPSKIKQQFDLKKPEGLMVKPISEL